MFRFRFLVVWGLEFREGGGVCVGGLRFGA